MKVFEAHTRTQFEVITQKENCQLSTQAWSRSRQHYIVRMGSMDKAERPFPSSHKIPTIAAIRPGPR